MRRAGGFTLLELLISLSIFALISVMAYGGMTRVLAQREQTEVQAQRLKYLQLAFGVLARDLEQAVERRVRDSLGSPLEALIGGSGQDGMEFTRLGFANPAGLPRSEVQRVVYVHDDGRLLRRTWRVLDRAQDSVADEQVLMEGVRDFSLRFLDQNSEWQPRWPPPAGLGSAGPVAGLPRAIEVTVESDDFDRLTWLFRLPQPVAAGTGTGSPAGGGGAS